MFSFFFFNDTATTEIYTLSLHDALPISLGGGYLRSALVYTASGADTLGGGSRSITGDRDRKSTRLNSSHLVISYAVFCLKKKKTHQTASEGCMSVRIRHDLEIR